MNLIILIIFLIIILQLNILPNFVMYLILFLVSYIITDDIVYTFIVSTPIFIILYLINISNKNIQEKFENNDEEESNNVKIKKNPQHDKETMKKVNHLKKIINKLENGISLTNDDLIEKNDLDDFNFDKSVDNDDDLVDIEKKETKDYTPSEAQKQTYKLIDTVKQLNSTIKTLGPTLEMGKQVMDKMKKYKL
jgi:hypothetical protein